MRRSPFGKARTFAGLSAALSLATLALAASGAESVWSKVKSPARGTALSIGSYSGGCVQGARELPSPGSRRAGPHLRCRARGSILGAR